MDPIRLKRPRPRPIPIRSATAAAILLAATPPLARAADVTATWSAPLSGTWTDPTHWSTAPAYPNNAPGGATTYDALLAATGPSPYTVTLNTDVSLRSLRLDSPAATLSHVSGTLTSSLPIQLSAGSYSLVSGTLRNTTVVADAPGELLTVAKWYLPIAVPTYVTGATLDTVTLDTDVLLNDQASLILTNSTSLPGRTITMAATDYFARTTLDLRSTPPGGTLDIRLAGKSGMNVVRNGSIGTGTLTIGPGTTVRTATAGGTVGDKNWSDTVVQGLVSAETPGQSIVVTGHSVTNFGTLRATNHSALAIDSNYSWTNLGTITADNGTVYLGGHFTPASIGNISLANNGIVNSVGWLDATTVPLTLSASLPLGIAGGAISGTIASADGTPLVARSRYGGTLSNATVDAPVSIPSLDAALTVSSSVLNQPVSVSGGGKLTLAGAWTNNSTITVSSGGTLSLGSGTPPPSFGNLSVGAYSILEFTSNNYSTAALDRIPTTATMLRVTANASLDNTGRTLTLGTPAVSFLDLEGGTLKGGTVAEPASGSFVIGWGGTLDSVTLAAGASLFNGGSLTFTGGLTLANGATISLAPRDASDSVSLASSGDQSLTGTGTISFDGPAGTAALRPATYSGSLTVGPGITIRTGTNSGSVGLLPYIFTSLDLHGTVSAQTPGTTLRLRASALSNSGTLAASNSSTLYILASSSFTNTGTITVDPTSTLILAATAASGPNGTINLAGTALLDYTGTSPADTVRQQLAAGSISTPTPGRTIAYVEASQLPPEAARLLAGGHSLDATTLLLFPTPQGDANLDGRITPDDYALLDRSLVQHLTTAHWTDGDFNYDGVVDASDFLLIDSTYLSTHPASAPEFLAQRESQFGAAYVQALRTSVPEPTSPLACLFATSLLTRRRKLTKSHRFCG